MDKRRLRRLAHIIRKDPRGRVPARLKNAKFSMHCFLHVHNKPVKTGAHMKRIPPSGCGTVGCIGGWASLLWGDRTNYHNTPVYQILGLSLIQTQELMMPVGYKSKGLYPPERCAAVIDHLIETGKVDWNIDWEGQA